MAEAEKIQFHRPANNDDFKQSKVEKDILSVTILMGYSNATAYALFHPELCDRSTGKLNKAGQRECRMFFSHPNNIAYMDAMRAHLEALTKGMVKVTSDDVLTDSRKDNALKTLVSRALSLMEKGEDLDPETIKTIADIANKLKLIKEEQEQEIRPLRFLPSRCKSECRYRAFVETMKLENRVFDDCSYCRARAYAEERGFKYDPCKLLDVPQDVIDELDSKNNIRLEDILSGKVNN